MLSTGDPMALILLKLTDRYESLMANPPARVLHRGDKALRGRLQRRAAAAV